MRKAAYTILEHTADIRIAVEAGDLAGIFINTAAAMFDLIASPLKTSGGGQISLDVDLAAEDKEELFIDWLNELLSLSAVKHLIFSQFRIDLIDDKRLRACVTGKPMDFFKVNKEIKAATYHELSLEHSAGLYIAKVIFDV